MSEYPKLPQDSKLYLFRNRERHLKYAIIFLALELVVLLIASYTIYRFLIQPEFFIDINKDALNGTLANNTIASTLIKKSNSVSLDGIVSVNGIKISINLDLNNISREQLIDALDKLSAYRGLLQNS